MNHNVMNESLYLDRICMVGIFVEPITYAHVSMEKPPDSVKVHLRVVDEEGEPFTELGLSRMCLGRAEVSHIERLCRRRILAMSKKYLPRGATDISFLPEECSVDSNGLVRITFYVCGSTHNAAHT